MTKKIFSLILCMAIAASVLSAVSVNAADNYSGAEITLDGTAPYAITKNSPFKDVDFGDEDFKQVEFTVNNKSTQRIKMVYIVWEWACDAYSAKDKERKLDGMVFYEGIDTGASKTFTLNLPKSASMWTNGYGKDNLSYSDLNLRFDFEGTPASGETVIISSDDQSVTNNFASAGGFQGISETKGISFSYKGAEITLNGETAYAITKNSPFSGLDFGSSLTKAIKFTVYNQSSQRINMIYIAWEWATKMYNPENETEELSGGLFNSGIEAGASATFTFTIPKNATILYGNYGVHNALYNQFNLRFDFASAPESGEKITVVSSEQSVNDNLAKCGNFKGITSSAGISTLPGMDVYLGAEITLEGRDYAITKNSPFANLDFGNGDTRDVRFTVYNTTSTTITMMYIASEWNTTVYAPDDETTPLKGVTFSEAIAPGEATAVKFTLPKAASILYNGEGNRNIPYTMFNLRINFASAPTNGEKIYITSNEQSIINGFVNADNFSGIVSTIGVNELPNIRPSGEEPDYSTGVKQTDGSITYANGFVPVTDGNVLYSGRWSDGETGSKTLGFEGYTEIAFTGTSFALIKPLSGNLYYSIDGQSPVSTAVWGKKEALLVSKLAEGEHRIRIYAQAQNAGLEIGGFRLDDGASTLPIKKGKIIEFIGDSITEGYVAPADATSWGANSYMNSYARLTGEMLNKKYGMSFNTIAFGGCGLLNLGTDPLPMSTRYFKAVEKQSNDTAETVVPDWDMSKYTPDYIVINLGTNDRGKDANTFKTEYIDFVKKIRQTYPNVEIVLIVPYQFYAENLTGFVNAVRETSTSAENIHLVETADWNFKGGADGLHPAPAAHIAAAEKLFAYLSELIDEPAFSLNLDSGKTLDFNYYATFADTDVNATMDIIRDGEVVSTLTGVKEGSLRYKFTYSDIAPQCMADEITAELKVNGKTVATRTDSIKSYCEKVLATSDGETYKTFMADMLVYGQALADYKNIDKTIVDASDTWIAESKTDFDTVKSELVSVRNAGTATDENNKIKSAGLYFYDINKIYFRAEINGGTVKINGKEATAENGKYYTDGIAASKFGETFTVTVDANGAETHKVTYSVNSYVLAKCEGEEKINVLARALGCYGYSASKLV